MAHADEPTPLTWEPRPTIRASLTRALSLPALIGIGVFLVVAIATTVILLQGQGANSGGVLAQQAIGPVATQNSTQTKKDKDESKLEAQIFVHVVGEVLHPGLVELPEGARVLDAIEAAGGANTEAGLEGVNLARVVSDGEQIAVPTLETAEQLAAGIPIAPESASGGSANGGVLNLNQATAEQLEQLPKIGPALAQRIIDWRDANGSFSSVDQLLEVSGIGEKTLDQFRDRVGV
ncbi:helix-hairpin-helix domain-containing protein [Leucobacter denitrificans]|uniref:helix-hairpin-helix domain-containing protein n=1 Tax=Leucobacter denitrificans TaxID=683042 RepID=UPI001FEA5C9A|nr:helix-hairpin-helix domain-containing protein [Leucobacter denitrificans]